MIVKSIAERETYAYIPRGPKGEAGSTEFGTIANVTEAYNILSSDDTIICNSAVAFTVTLPIPTFWQILFIKNIGTGAVTVSRAGATIDGEATQVLNQYDCLMVQYVSTNVWVIL